MKGEKSLLTNEQLQCLIEEQSKLWFNKPFSHKASFNARLRTTGGRYLLSSHNIEINPKYLDEYGQATLIGIIKHELCHYHLHIEGKGYQHRDHDFKEILKKVDAPRYCQTLPSQQKKQTFHQYTCSGCGKKYQRKRRMNLRKYVCGSCHGRLNYAGEVFLNNR